MRNIKIDFRNIWNLFYVIFFGGFILISLLLYLRYENIVKEHHAQVRHYTEIIKTSVSSNFTQHEIVLNILGYELLKDNHYKNEEFSKNILDDIISHNPYFAAVGVADINGNILVSSSNVKSQNYKNLLQKETTKYDFKRALKSDDMVIGRTYFFNNISKWIIPLRKLIKDKNGKALGVAIAGLNNEKNSNYLDALALSKDKTVLIIKDFDMDGQLYRQYCSNSSDISNKLLYSDPISSEKFIETNNEIFKKYDFDIEELRRNSKTVSVTVNTQFDDKSIVGIVYDKKYKIWIIVASKYSDVLEDFLNILLAYIGLFIVSIILFYMLFKNIATNEKRKEEALIYESEHDRLTSLPNRTYMYNNIESWKEKHKNSYDVLYLDLDNFKNINDKFGHSIGDEILIEVAARLKLFFSSDDMLIRQGGDEFIVLKECLDAEHIHENFEKLISLIAEVYYVDNKEFRIGMSIGIARYPKDATTIEELLSLSDTAMYEAKRRRNSFCFFSEKLRASSTVKTDIEQELRGAIENKELWMVYQPQINIDGSLYGVEALVRWENKKLGFVGPDKFISVAEDSGLIKDIGKFIIQTSLREIISIQAKLKTIFSLSINISVIQLMETSFLKDILELINKEAFDKSLVTLEITESLSIEDLDEVLPILHAIREEGMEISLDDFGTGYSSLSMLRELPINELKIDKSFIDKILYDDSENTLVKSIIDIGKNFKMKTLAEGVENLEQLQELKLAKCDIIQGYYYSRPLIKDDLISYIEKLKVNR